MRQQYDVEVVMRDGVTLRFDLYMPDCEEACPVILLRTPYGKEHIGNDPLYSDFERYTSAGYHVAIQDCRGTGRSDGVLHCNGDREYYDGWDTVEWLAVQPFCTGHVGMFGLSYYGFDQMACAVTAPPHLDIICPFMTQALPPYGASIRHTVGSYHLFWIYGQLLRELPKHIPDEAKRKELEPILKDRFEHLEAHNFQLPMNQNPAATIPGVSMFEEYLRVVDGIEDETFWRSVGRPAAVEKLRCAVFHATGWFDGMKDTTVDDYQAVRDHGSEYAKAHNALLIGPWAHGGELTGNYDGVHFGAENTGDGQDVKGRMLRWFDHYTKGIENGVCADAPVRYYVMGEDRWHEDTDWPPTAAKEQLLYLHAGGLLSSACPAAEEPDTFTYDPQHPMPSGLRDSQGRFLIPDWSEMPAQDGILTYETEMLEQPMTVAGVIEMTLYAVTDAKDTDFSCRAVAVQPDGFEFELASGIIRARYREGVLFHPSPIVPGEITRYDITVGSTGYRLEKGYRLKVYLSSALYPAHDRNLNTGAPIGKTDVWVEAHQTVLHDALHPSSLRLPVLPETEKAAPQ